MFRNCWTGMLIGTLILIPVSSHAFEAGEFFLNTVNQALSEGAISQEEAYLQTFYYAFDRDLVREDLLGTDTKPLKCFADVISTYEEEKGNFSSEAVAVMDGYLALLQAVPKTASTYISPSGIFEFTYSTTGSNAVSATDVAPANGIPDYVEKCAIYADSSWTREVDEVGLNAPNLTSGVYPMSFQNMGAYGFAVSTGGGRSRIVIENNFIGFPANDDPDGNQLGAAKATIAHEFKHATQFNTGSWDGWAEMDATSIEDIVFDDTNDFYNYIGSGDGISSPSTPLDSGGGASYEDAIWQLFMAESFGVTILEEHATRRQNFPGESATASYKEVFQSHGSTWNDEFINYATWNYLTGLHAQSTLPGYGEAADLIPIFPGLAVTIQSADYPYSTTDTQSNLSTLNYKVRGLDAITGKLRIEFDGLSTKIRGVVLLTKVRAAFGGGWEREDIPLDANMVGDYTSNRPGAEILQGAVLVIYPGRNGSDESFNLTISNQVITTIDAAIPTLQTFVLDQNRPNPFNPTTSISFSLPEKSAVSLHIYNPAGRLVRTLLTDDRAAGSYSITWDGRDDSGFDAGSGVYHYQLRAGRQVDTKRMILIR